MTWTISLEGADVFERIKEENKFGKINDNDCNGVLCSSGKFGTALGFFFN